MEANSNTTHLGHWIKMINHLSVVKSNRILKSFGLTRESWYILSYVYKENQISQKKLQDILGINSGSMAIIVDGLVRKGWLFRIPDENDRRANLLRLTQEGTTRWKVVPDVISLLREEMMSGITKEEEESAVAVLKKCWTNLYSKDVGEEEKEMI